MDPEWLGVLFAAGVAILLAGAAWLQNKRGVRVTSHLLFRVVVTIVVIMGWMEFPG